MRLKLKIYELLVAEPSKQNDHKNNGIAEHKMPDRAKVEIGRIFFASAEPFDNQKKCYRQYRIQENRHVACWNKFSQR